MLPGFFRYLISLTVFSLASIQALQAASPARPNIVFVLLDDQRWDDLGCAGHPVVKTPNIDRLTREGVSFQWAFVTTPLCSSSRASFLTGQYVHYHGVIDNTVRDALSRQLVTFPRRLHEVGCESAFIGKWHMGLDDTPRPGFDHWVSIGGQGNYLDPEINVNGRRHKVPGYVTDIFSDFAVDFLKREHQKPFLLYLAHKAVRPDLVQAADGSLSDPSAGKFIPAERHKLIYDRQPIPRRPNFGRPPLDKPALMRRLGSLPPLGPASCTDDETVRNRLRMLASVDEGLGRMLRVLEDSRQLDNSLIIFTGDEGYFYGEHGLSVERRLAYEESALIPLLMRWPKLIKSYSVVEEFVLNIDLAPALLEVAGAPVPKDLDGCSLVPLLEGKRVT